MTSLFTLPVLTKFTQRINESYVYIHYMKHKMTKYQVNTIFTNFKSRSGNRKPQKKIQLMQTNI